MSWGQNALLGDYIEIFTPVKGSIERQMYGSLTTGLLGCMKRVLTMAHVRNPGKHLTLAVELPYNKSPYQKNKLLGEKCFLIPLG